MNARDDDGITLVELLVVMTLATVLMLAVFQGFDVFSRSTNVATRSTQAQNDARTVLSDMVTTLRQARIDPSAMPPVTPVAAVPTTTDVTVAAWGGPTGDIAGFVRYCASGSGTVLQRGWVATTAAVPPASTCGTNDNGWTYGVALAGTLQTTQPLFTFQCGASACSSLAAATAATGIGIRLAVGIASGGSTTYNAVLFDAVAFRFQS